MLRESAKLHSAHTTMPRIDFMTHHCVFLWPLLMKRFMSWTVISFSFLVLAFTVPTEPWRAEYIAVDPVGLREFTFSREYWFIDTFPRYVLKNDQLYLIAQ